MDDVSLDGAIRDLADLAARTRSGDPGSRGEVGGKAAGLAALLAEGHRVPAGFVIPCAAIAGLVSEDLATPLEQLGSAAVAVRSSGAEEDGDDSSLAGRHLSELPVASAPATVLAAVRRVHDSGHAVSVVVQAMVDARVSGVAFSVDPVTGDDRVVVTAVPGLGQPLVDGSVEGQSWTITPDDRVAGEGDLLAPDRLIEVAALLRGLAATRGRPVDVEWSVAAGTEELWLLQCRPVTVVPVAPTIEVPPGTWTKDVAHAPGPLSPMAASLDSPGFDFFADWAARFGFLVGGIRTAYLGGELYLQVVPPLGKETSTAPPPPWWLLGLLARVVPALRRRTAAARSVLDSGLLDGLARDWTDRRRAEMQERVARLRRTDLARLDDAALLAHAEDVRRLVAEGVRIHFDLFVPYLVRVHAFVLLTEELLGWTSAEALQVLAGSSPASAAASRRMEELASRIAAEPAAAAAVAGADDPVAALADLHLDRDPGLAAEVATWLEVEGFLLTDDDVASPTVAEVPGLLVGLLRRAVARLAGDSADPAPGDPSTALRNTAEQRLSAAMVALSPEQQRRLQQTWEAAGHAFGLREENVRVVGYAPMAGLRVALLEMGRRLADRGLLRDPDRTMLLTWDELTGALVGDVGEDGEGLDTVAVRRRAERAWVRAHPGPLVHGPLPGAPPDFRGLPAAARVLNEALLWAMDAELAPPAERPGAEVTGAPCGAGTATGPVRVVRGPADFDRLQAGDVLVCPIAPPAWATLFGLVGALVCDGGGPLSHAAIVAREHGLPTVMGAGNATTALRDGELVTVDGSTGTVTAVEPAG